MAQYIKNIAMVLLATIFAVALCALLPSAVMPEKAHAAEASSGTWGGIDWVLDEDGMLTISPTVNEIEKTKPYSDSGELYQVGEVPAAVNDAVDAIAGWPFAREEVRTLLIKEGVTSIGSFALQGLTNLTGEVVIPSTVTYIGQEAFQGSSMTKLTFVEGGVKELCIASGAFKNTQIVNAALPDDRPLCLHAWIFSNNSKLESVSFPATVKQFGGWTHHEYCGMDYQHNQFWYCSDVVSGCPKLKTVTFGSEEVAALFNAAQGNANTVSDVGATIGVGLAQVGGVKYSSLQAAIDAAVAGDVVTLLADVELTASLTIAADNEITLDLNGKKISYDSTVQGEAMITNKGRLTINDSAGAGEIYYNYTGAADSSYGKGNYTISNAGMLTVNAGKIAIADLRGHAKYPIDNNSTTGDAVLVVNGGHLYNYNTSAIRQFCNSTTNKNSVTINGGVIEGYCAIWMQNPGSKTVNGSLSITGGEIKSTANAYVLGTSELEDVGSEIYCSIDGNGGKWSDASFASITGGIFNENVDLAHAAPTATVNGPAKFYGRLELPSNVFTVSFDNNDGSSVEITTVGAGDKVVKPADPTRDDYIFAGWYADYEFAVAYDFETAVNGDLILVAKWIENSTSESGIEEQPDNPKKPAVNGGQGGLAATGDATPMAGVVAIAAAACAATLALGIRRFTR